MNMADRRTERVVIHRQGGPEVLDVEETMVDAPGAGELLVEHRAIGLNFADIYQRRGQSGPHGETRFPFTPGSLAAGVIIAKGLSTDAFEVGGRIAYLHPGAYVGARAIPQARAVNLPADIDEVFAAAWLLRGLTAYYLLRQLYVVQPGEWCLVHAAAGGMGQVLTLWAKALGAHVIGTVGSTEKAGTARANGCDAVILHRQEDLAARVMALTDSQGVSVVYDAVGEDVFLPSLACLRPMGWMVSYGAASGAVSPVDIQRLHAKSLILTRPTLRTYVATSEALRHAAAQFFEAFGEGGLALPLPRRYALREVRKAHQDLESGRTMGAAVLIP